MKSINLYHIRVFICLGIMVLIQCSHNASAQVNLTIVGRVYNNSDDTWEGVNIPRSSPTKLIFKNNRITSDNRFGYMLQAGDESRTANNNNLDGAVISGNMLIWNGSDMEVIPHGIFTGHNSNVVVKYNYLNNVPMGIIRKSATNMTNTGGGAAYNIIRGGVVGIVIKGMSGVNIYNNTFYQDRSPSQTWRPHIHIYTNTDDNLNSVSHNTRIYNNIFYTKHKTPMITIEDQESLNGFECNYNLYWSEAGPPVFNVNGREITFEEWQQMGFDRNSTVMNPGFKDHVNLIPGSRLDFGTDLGLEWAEGLAVNAVWSNSDPATAYQNGKWQVGARIFGEDIKSDMGSTPLHIQSVINDTDHSTIEMTFNQSLSDVLPDPSSFHVNVNGANVAIEGVTVSGSKVFVKVSMVLMHEDDVTISYNKPSANPLKSIEGNEAHSLNPHVVVNNILSGAPAGRIKIFPNPAKQHFYISNIDSEKLPQVIRIYDLSGKLKFERIMQTEVLHKVPVNLRPGAYILYMKLGSDVEHKQKLLIIR